MKVSFLCLVIAFAFFWANNSFAQEENKFVKISGQLINFSNQAEVQDMSEMQYLHRPDIERMVVPDAEGIFTISFPLRSPNYFRLGRNILYLTPGDNLEVVIDKNDPQKSEISGRGSEANLYLRSTPFPKGGSFMAGGSTLEKNQQETIDAIFAIADKRKNDLAKVTGVSEEFRRLENARIKADIINSLQSISSYGTYTLRLKEDSAKKYNEQVKALITPLVKKYSKDFVDPSLMKIEVYRDISYSLIKSGGKEKDINKITDWQSAFSLVRRMNNESDKEKLQAFKEKVNTIQTPVFKQAAEEYLESLIAFGNGDTAVDFTAIDLNGNDVKLSSLKGKVIYIDLWATWCGPCMAEMPHFEKLKERYMDNENVAFVSLSIDDGEDVWKYSVNNRNADGIQWLIDRNRLNSYNIVGIPRILVIDKDFRMAEMNGPSPSSREASRLIDKLLK